MFEGLLEKLSFIESHRFVLTVGDQGAILTYFYKKRLLKRFFASSSAPDRIEDFTDILKRHPSAPISILVDVMDQSYVQNALPPVGVLSIGKLVKHKLKRDFADTDLTGAIPLGRSKEGRKDWQYIFISAPMVPPLSDWMEFIYQLPNRCEGIYLLPIETIPLVTTLSTIIAKQANSKVSEWQILGCHDKVGGFRQVVVHNSKIIFTRMINAALDNFPDIVAGNIEQELLNTLEYLKRLSLQENTNIDIYISVADDIKQCIDGKNLKNCNVSLFTPFELATTLGIQHAAAEEDKFIDTVIASSFVQHKPILRLFTDTTKHFDNLYQIQRYVLGVASLVIPLFFIYNAYILVGILNLYQEIEYTQTQKDALEAKWNLESKNFGEYDIETATKISNITTLYKLLSDSKESPLTTISDFGTIKGNAVQVKSMDWKLEPVDPNVTPTDTPPINQISLSLDVMFTDSGKSFDSLFTNFDKFIYQLQKAFAAYKVEHSPLPSKINFEQTNEGIPIKIDIKGPITTEDGAKEGQS